MEAGGIKASETTVNNRRGQQLHVYQFHVDKPKAVVLFHHGYSEYCAYHHQGALS